MSTRIMHVYDTELAAKKKQHQSLVVHALPRAPSKRLSTLRRQVQTGATLNADRGLRVGIDCYREGKRLRDVSSSRYRNKKIFLHVTYPDLQGGGFTCGLKALIKKDQLPPVLRRERATTMRTLIRDRCASRNVALNYVTLVG